MERDNITQNLEDVGAVVLANACGPCIGQASASISVCGSQEDLTVFIISGNETIKRERITVSPSFLYYFQTITDFSL